MVKIDMPFLNEFKVKGHTYTFFRRGAIRQRIDPKSPNFASEYDRLVRQSETMPEATKRGTLGHLCEAWKSSPEFKQLSKSSKRAYTAYLGHLDDFRDVEANAMTRSFVLRLRDRLADKPRTANYLVATIRTLYKYGILHELVKHNPAAEVPKFKGSKRYRAWADNECDAFVKSDPPLMMLRAYMLAVHTGQRQGDILALPVRAYDGQEIRLSQSKTMQDGEEITIPARRVLREFLDVQTWTALMMIHMTDGRPVKPDYFRHQFRKALNNAGLHHLHFHGLRHTMGQRLSEADGDVASILGHKTEKMARHYSSTARQKIKARTAIAKLDQEN